jgi:hypothetical protein
VNVLSLRQYTSIGVVEFEVEGDEIGSALMNSSIQQSNVLFLVAERTDGARCRKSGLKSQSRNTAC